MRLAPVLLSAALAACSPLSIFGAVVPKDRGGALVAQGLRYGPGGRGLLDVYAPRRHDAAPRPVVIFFYGGSWNSGDRASYAFVGRALAAQGFVTVIPDYRLVPQVRYPAFLQDNAAATRWVADNIARHGGDPRRIALMGHSAGAYNAAMLALDPRWLRQAGVDPARIEALVGLAGPYDFAPFDQPVTRAAFGNASDRAATQPVNHVQPGVPPALLAAGLDDRRVLPRNSERLGMLLRAVGVSVEQKRYAGIGHAAILLALSKPLRGRAPVLADVARFLHERLDKPARR